MLQSRYELENLCLIYYEGSTHKSGARDLEFWDLFVTLGFFVDCGIYLGFLGFHMEFLDLFWILGFV